MMKKFLIKELSLIGKLIIAISIALFVVRACSVGVFLKNKHRNFHAPAEQVFVPEAQSFTFAIMSDTGAKDEIMEKMVRRIVKQKPDFILHLGDLVRYRNIEHFKWVAEELDAELGNTPFYMIPGNHEIYSEDGKYGKKVYKEIFGSLYYWFSYGNTLFIGLDTSEEKIDDDQFLWLENILVNVRPNYENCIIFMHAPPKQPEYIVGHEIDENSQKKFTKIIKDKEISLILAGHVHTFEKMEFEGIPLITAPSSGQKIRSPIKKLGYFTIKITDDNFRIRVKYLDIKSGGDFWEVFFSHSMVKIEVLYTSFILFLLGVLLVFISKRKCH